MDQGTGDQLRLGVLRESDRGSECQVIDPTLNLEEDPEMPHPET